MAMKEQKHASELMPQSKEALHILQTRAKQLAKQEIDRHEINGVAYVRFKSSQNENYGVPYHYVQEILHNVTVAKPPFVPNFVAGVINWRGTLIPIVDLITFFHSNHVDSNLEHQSEFILVINAQNITLGFIAHQIEGSAIYQPDELKLPLHSMSVANPEYILGLHHAVTAILNIDLLISGISQKIKKNLQERRN